MPGFDFSNYNRNVALQARGFPAPRLTSTGTTIVGCMFDGGVVIAADTRSTMGPIIADKNCAKLHYVAPRIWCAGAGTAADLDFVTNMVSSQLELHSLSTGREPRVLACLTMLKQHLFRYHGHVGAHLVVGGCDPTGTMLFHVAAHGSSEVLPYLSSGSGSMAAMSVLETQWKEGMSRDEAVKLISDAILAGIWNDLGSGSNVDVTVITQEKTTLLRNYMTPNKRVPKLGRYIFPKGTTAVLDEKIIRKEDLGNYVSVQELSLDEGGAGAEKMEVDS